MFERLSWGIMLKDERQDQDVDQDPRGKGNHAVEHALRWERGDR